MKLENRLQQILLTGLALTDVTSAQGFGIGASGPTSRGYQEALPYCGKPRFHHNVNLFFELPDERKRRETSDALLESEQQSEPPSPAVSRSNGNLSWLTNSKKEFRKEERTKDRKLAKGKTGDSHLDSQRLIGGQEAIPHSWPWQVFVKIEGKSGGYDCGGSIIGKRWILTAAHCVPYRPVPSMSYVYAGIHTIHTGPRQKLKVKRVIVHEKYGFPILDNNDIALIELERDLEFTPKVQPICMPDKSLCLPHGLKCAATGWGVTDKFGTQIPNELNEVAVKLIEKEHCESMHSDYSGQLSDQMICAGYKEGGKDACLGDSGGPLACQVEENGPWVLYGITSWGIGCGDPLHPGVYTRVTELVEWIETHSGVNPAISSGDFPQHQCAGQDLGAVLLSSQEEPVTKVPVTSRKETDKSKASVEAATEEPKLQDKPKTNTHSADDFDLQALIEDDLKEVETCGGSTDLAAGSLRSPGYGKKYPNNLKCLWQIKPDINSNEYVEIEFKKNDVGKCADRGHKNNLEPKNDYVAILDSDGQVIKTTLCRASNNSPLYVYSKKSASIFMSSDGSSADNGKGFRMRFKTLNYVPSQCGDKKYQSLASDETIHISSQNFPNRYLGGVSCAWNIVAPLGHQLIVSIDQMDLGGKKGTCGASYTSVTEEGVELKKYCGKMSKKATLNSTIRTSGNSIDVNFEAGKVSQRGFKLKIKAVPANSPKAVRALASSGNAETLAAQSVEQLVTRFEKIWSILKIKLGVSDADY